MDKIDVVNKKTRAIVDAEPKDSLMSKFLKGEGKGYIFVSPSLKEGCDFKGDRCRAQIILKKPIPYFGDLFNKFHAKKDNAFMETCAAIDMIQMVGRNVRSPSDWGMTFIYDTAATRIFGFLVKDPRAMTIYRSLGQGARASYDIAQRYVKYDYITEAIVTMIDGSGINVPAWPLDPTRRLKNWENFIK
jgi:Rad3-related DNA helicase